MDFENEHDYNSAMQYYQFSQSQQFQQKQQQQKKCLNDFTLIIVLGKGTYAKVVLVREKATKQIYAMKILKKKYIKKVGQEEHIKTERNVLVSITHPFIIKLYYSFQNEKNLYFVMEYAPGGELFNLLAKRGKFTEDQARFYAAQIVLALEQLHNHNIIYRDLKPENVLLDNMGYIRISDFGLSKSNVVGLKDAFSFCGTPEYLAPEILFKQGHGKPIDCWALGAIIYELLTGLPPFYSENREELFERIKRQDLVYPPHITKPGQDLLRGLFQKDPEMRLGTKGGIAEIKNHPWFINVNWGILLNKQYKPPYKPQLKSDDDFSNFNPGFTNEPVQSQSNGNSIQQTMDNKTYNNWTYAANLNNETYKNDGMEEENQ